MTWATDFQAFTLFHLATALGCVLVVAAICGLGRSLREPSGQARGERLVRGVVTTSTVGWQAFAVTWYACPPNYDPLVSWPLHLCDLAGWIMPLALLTQWTWARSVLYFWGIGLSTQAFLTPVLDAGYAQPEYWIFWVGHTQIVGGAIYDVVVLRFRPRWKHYVIAFLFGLVYALSMIAVNRLHGANYGYLGQELPEAETILHQLPPWPWRPISLMAIAASAQFLALVPWLLLSAKNRRNSSSASDTIEL